MGSLGHPLFEVLHWNSRNTKIPGLLSARRSTLYSSSLALRDAAAVSIPAQRSSVLAFLRDAKVRKFAEKIVIYMDLLTICIDVKGNLLGHTLNNMCQDWCILSNELTGMTLYNVTTLTIIVTESKRRRIWRESLLVPELFGFHKKLYEAWAASVIATLGTFPNLVSLTVNVKLNGLSRECFWWALRSSLKERFRRITKLRLQSDVGPRCMASMDHMFEVALKFPTVQRRDFSGPAEVMHRWHGYHDLSEQFTRRIRRMDAWIVCAHKLNSTGCNEDSRFVNHD